MKKIDKKFLIILILTIGVLYKLLITRDGNFIFNMDNARDMVDVREMVILHKLRLTGPTSGIEGFYNGPGWYYLLAIPFVLSEGDPYTEILLMVLLWTIGGYFLLKIASRFGITAIVLVGSLWVASNYVTLTTVYAFNPNPVILLTPLAIFCLEKYLLKNNLLYGVAIWFLAGAFFNFEMAFGLFMPPIIFASIMLSGKIKYFTSKNFWIGFSVFIATLLPQLFFNFRHQGILGNSLANHLTSTQTTHETYHFVSHARGIIDLYTSTIQATFMNSSLLEKVFFGLVILCSLFLIQKKKTKINPLFAVLISFILIPFLGSIILPLNFMPWHLGGALASMILLFGVLVSSFLSFSKVTKYIGLMSVILIVGYSIKNLEIPANLDPKRVNNDPSSFSNEVSAIDYAYQKAEGKNFRAYVYLPSVIDYPYQYLFWWYGRKKYGYTPKEYAYQPNKPQYISNKERFQSAFAPEDSGLVILIKEPNRPDLEDLWKNSFTDLELLSSAKVGSLSVEVRK